MTRQGTHTRFRPHLAAAALLALAALAVALIPARAGAAVPRDFWGVSPQTTLTDKDFDRMGKGRVGTLRIPIFWSLVDQSSDPGDTYWADIDAIVAGTARNGVEVLPFVFGTPEWVARGLDGRGCTGAKCGLFAPKSAAALDAWKAFVGEFVDRYGSKGTFWDANPSLPKKPIDVVQVWNEQNSSSFFKPKPKPSAYAKLLAAAADAVRTRDSSIEIILGGMPQLQGSKKAVAGSEYLEDLYKVSGVEANFEGVAIHPYGASVDKVADQVELFRKVMKRAGDAGASLWVTEVGAGSATGGNPLNRGKQGQAKLLKDTFKYFAKGRNRLNVENVTWFSWMDAKVSICDWCKTSGLFKKGLREKPAWKAFTKFTNGS